MNITLKPGQEVTITITIRVDSATAEAPEPETPKAPKPAYRSPYAIHSEAFMAECQKVQPDITWAGMVTLGRRLLIAAGDKPVPIARNFGAAHFERAVELIRTRPDLIEGVK